MFPRSDAWSGQATFTRTRTGTSAAGARTAADDVTQTETQPDTSALLRFPLSQRPQPFALGEATDKAASIAIDTLPACTGAATALRASTAPRTKPTIRR